MGGNDDDYVIEIYCDIIRVKLQAAPAGRKVLVVVVFDDVNKVFVALVVVMKIITNDEYNV